MFSLYSSATSIQALQTSPSSCFMLFYCRKRGNSRYVGPAQASEHAQIVRIPFLTAAVQAWLYPSRNPEGQCKHCQDLPRKPYNGESRSRGGQDARCTVSICSVELPPKPTRISGVAENIGLELGGKENWNSKRILIILWRMGVLSFPLQSCCTWIHNWTTPIFPKREVLIESICPKNCALLCIPPWPHDVQRFKKSLEEIWYICEIYREGKLESMMHQMYLYIPLYTIILYNIIYIYISLLQGSVQGRPQGNS